MKFFKSNLIVFLALLLVSCSSPKEEPKVERVPDDAEFVEEQVATVEADPRKPLFVYKNQLPNALDEIILQLNSEPVLLTSGYVRLVGVVSGGKPLALVEVGGKGRCVSVGDSVEGYLVDFIYNDKVKLFNKKGV